MDKRNLIGFIPAGGKGTRMEPLTKNIPKVLVEVDGMTLLERSLKVLSCIGVQEFVIAVNHHQDLVRRYIELKHYPYNIKLVEENSLQLGIPYALFNARKQLGQDVIVFCPDNIFSEIDDLKNAADAFEKYKPIALQVVTVVPEIHHSRFSHYSGKLRNIDPNLYSNKFLRPKILKHLSLTSTGVTFLSKRSFKFLPSFTNVVQEYPFADFLHSIYQKDQFLIYLLRGARYDLTTASDVKTVQRLAQKKLKLIKKGVSIILMDINGRILLNLRDDNPQISYPNHWGLIGGGVELESTDEAIIREVKEEIGYQLQNFGLLREYVFNGKLETAYVGELNTQLNKLVLMEGQKVGLFWPKQISQLLLRPDDKETIEFFYNRKL